MFITCDTVLTSHVQHSTFNVQFSTSSVRDLVDHYVRFTLEPDLAICNTGSVNIPIPVQSLHSSVSEAWAACCYRLSFWSKKTQNKLPTKCSDGAISPSHTVVTCMSLNAVSIFFHWLHLIQQGIQLERLQACGVPTHDAIPVLALPVWMLIRCLPFFLLIAFDTAGHPPWAFILQPWWHPWGSSLWRCPCPYLFCSSAVLECHLCFFNGLDP